MENIISQHIIGTHPETILYFILSHGPL